MNQQTEQPQESGQVRITYPVPDGSGTVERELPFVIGVLADVSAQNEDQRPRLSSLKFVPIDRENFDAVLAHIMPSLQFRVPNRLESGDSTLNVHLRFQSLSDFEPERVTQQVRPLLLLLEERKRPGASIDSVDRLLSEQLYEILHAPAFRRLEATWRSLYYLVSCAADWRTVRIRVLDVGKSGLARDVSRAGHPDQTLLFKRLHDDEFGVLGGEPCTVLVGDYEFGNHPEDLGLLAGLSRVAAAVQAPFLAAAAPGLFGWEDFSELDRGHDFDKIFAGPAYAKWRSFRDLEEARYCALALPRVMVRRSYGEIVSGGREYRYEEPLGPQNCLWGNAAFTLAARAADVFETHHWCASIHRAGKGAWIDALPTWSTRTVAGIRAERCPSEVALAPAAGEALALQGLTGLCYFPEIESAAFPAPYSCLKPKKFVERPVTEMARLSVQLRYTLIAARFGQTIRMLAAQSSTAFAPSTPLQQYLNEWVSGYVAAEEEDADAGHPLLGAGIEVKMASGPAGGRVATLVLQPGYQLAGETVLLRLAFSLSGPG